MIRSTRFELRMSSRTNSLINGSETWLPWNGGIHSGTTPEEYDLTTG